MKLEELRQLSVDDLKLQLEDALVEIENFRFQHSTHQLDNPLLLRFKRKEISRIKTLLRERDLGIAK